MGKTRDTGFLGNCVFTDSSNNVGIGAAASGSYKFQVTGTTNLTSDLTVNGLTVGKGAASIVSNTVVGLSALPVNTTGTLNTAIGNSALLTNTTGYGNTSVGYSAIGYNTTGFFNAAVGVNALLFNSTGTYNNALGTAALYANTTGSYNTAVGQQAGTANTTGSNNTYIGYASGFNITTGSNNTIIGAYYGTAAMANNIVLADGAGNVRYQWDGTNNVFGNPLSGTSATFSGGTLSNPVLIINGNTSATITGNAKRLAQLRYNAGDGTGIDLGYDATAENGIIAGGTNTNGAGIDFLTYNGSSWGSRFLIAKSGAATFSSSVTAEYLTSNGGGLINTTSSPFILFNSSGGGNAKRFAQSMTNGDYMKIYSLNDNGTTRTDNIITATIGGNVGIGTSSPSQKLTIGATNGYPIIDFYNSGTGFGDIGYNAGISTFVLSSYSTTPLAFYTNGGERIKINPNGQSVITCPTSSVAALVVKNSASSVPAGQDIIFTTSPNNTTSAFLYCTDSTEGKFVVWSNGDVDSRTNSYGGWSDIKLKENITDATPKLQDLLKVKIKNYNFIGDDKKQIGVVAQELEEIFPALVSESPDFETDKETGERIDLGTTTKSVKYSVFVPMLIKAIQELNEKIKQLENK